MEFLQSVSKCFASRPSERNPALLRIYMNGDPLHAQSLQASIPLFIKSTIIQFGMEHGEELSLDFVINNELGLRQIGGVGEFSTLLFPQLLPELCHFVDTFQQHLKLLSQDYHDHPTKELIVERGFRGISMVSLLLKRDQLIMYTNRIPNQIYSFNYSILIKENG